VIRDGSLFWTGFALSTLGNKLLYLIRKPAKPNLALSRLLMGTLLITLLLLLSMLVRSSLLKERRPADTVKAAASVLPDDVEGVMNSFSYSEANDEVRIKISGKRVVRRGRRLLGLRSNLVKTNFIDQLSGTIRTSKGTTTFTAAQAEWDAESSRPLLLKKAVTVTINNKPLPRVKHARVFLKSGVIEAGGPCCAFMPFGCLGCDCGPMVLARYLGPGLKSRCVGA
jgi:hypothetical protein